MWMYVLALRKRIGISTSENVNVKVRIMISWERSSDYENGYYKAHTKLQVSQKSLCIYTANDKTS